VRKRAEAQRTENEYEEEGSESPQREQRSVKTQEKQDQSPPSQGSALLAKKERRKASFRGSKLWHARLRP
jgi:hypothetical protein